MTTLLRTFPATLDGVEAFCRDLRENLARLGPAGSPDAFAAEILAREAATNAVIHGCGRDPGLLVHCSLRIGPRRFRLRVSDQGPGFDWRQRSRTGSDVDVPGGRGLELYRAYAQRVIFNARGNSILLVRNLSGDRHE